MTIGLAGILAPAASAFARDGLERLLANDNLMEKAGALAGKGFANALQKGLNKLDSNLESVLENHPHAGGYAVPAAALHLKTFDADGDGSVSKAELAGGLQDINNQLQQSHGKGETARLNRMKTFAEKALAHYESLSEMDGKAGLSGQDVKTLAAYDGKAQFLSNADWRYFSPDA